MSNSIPDLVAAAQAEDLDFLLIGGNAIRLHGYLRNTLDVDFLVSVESYSDWRTFLEEHGYKLFHATDAFAQFEATGPALSVPVDLMLVAPDTWRKLRETAQNFDLGEHTVALPRPEHLVALKLHSALSEYRSRPEQDWEDIRQLVKICRLDPSQTLFKEIILRYGDKDALERIEAFYDECEKD